MAKRIPKPNELVTHQSPLPKQERYFARGERVRVRKKTWVVDEKREHEGFAPGQAEPICDNVTGIEGKIVGTPYASPEKGGEVCATVMVGSGGIIGVPMSRLERADRTAPSARREGREGGKGAYSRETIDFWREYFRSRGELKDDVEI